MAGFPQEHGALQRRGGIHHLWHRSRSAYRLLEDALNLRDIRIYDTIEDADGRERRVLNAKETTLATQKQQLIRDAFKDWIWKTRSAAKRWYGSTTRK